MSEKLCPLCQQANLCKAGTAEQNQCWCMTQQFPPELLAQAPDQSSCICSHCLEKFNDQITRFHPA